MDSAHAEVTATRSDIVSDQSLGAGTYTLQNKSISGVHLWLRDAAVTDVDTLDAKDAELIPPYLGGPVIYRVTIAISAGDAVYLGLPESATISSAIVGIQAG